MSLWAVYICEDALIIEFHDTYWNNCLNSDVFLMSTIHVYINVRLYSSVGHENPINYMFVIIDVWILGLGCMNLRDSAS